MAGRDGSSRSSPVVASARSSGNQAANGNEGKGATNFRSFTLPFLLVGIACIGYSVSGIFKWNYHHHGQDGPGDNPDDDSDYSREESKNSAGSETSGSLSMSSIDGTLDPSSFLTIDQVSVVGDNTAGSPKLSDDDVPAASKQTKDGRPPEDVVLEDTKMILDTAKHVHQTMELMTGNVPNAIRHEAAAIQEEADRMYAHARRMQEAKEHHGIDQSVEVLLGVFRWPV